MNATDVFAELPFIQAALQNKEMPPDAVPVADGWGWIFQLKDAGFKEWLIWHHRTFHKEASREPTTNR